MNSFFSSLRKKVETAKKMGPCKSLTLVCPLQVASFLGPLSSGSGRVQFDAELLRKITTLFQLLSKQQKRNKEGQ
jgi:hypothetical protein